MKKRHLGTLAIVGVAVLTNDTVQEKIDELPICSPVCLSRRYFEEPPALTGLDARALELCPDEPDEVVTNEALYTYLVRDAASDRRLVDAVRRAGGTTTASFRWVDNQRIRTSADEEIALAVIQKWGSTRELNAFTHVFCGDYWDSRKGKSSGLHWLPRYAQLEAEGRVCLRDQRRGAGPTAHLVELGFDGVFPWSCATKDVSSFAHDVEAVDLLAAGVYGFALCCEGNRREGVFTDPRRRDLRWQIRCNGRHGDGRIDTIHPTTRQPTCDPKWPTYDWRTRWNADW